jgi:hypothetical protein
VNKVTKKFSGVVLCFSWLACICLALLEERQAAGILHVFWAMQLIWPPNDMKVDPLTPHVCSSTNVYRIQNCVQVISDPHT